MALLTIAQQQLIKYVSPNWSATVKSVGGTTNFEQLQTEVENTQFRKLIGNAFLYNIQKNPTDPEIVKLLDGAEFNDCNGNPIEFKGIRLQLAYMNWSKYVSTSHYADTFAGMVRQDRQESTPLSSGDIKRTQLDAQEIALSDFEIMKLYLNDNSTTYPLWNCTKTKKIYTPKITGVRKTVK